MSVVRLWVYECNKMDPHPTGWYFLWVGIRGWGWGVPLVYECYKMVGGTFCGLGVVGWGSI